MSERLEDIRQIKDVDLENWLIHKGFSSFRVKQILDWLWVKGVSSFEEMSNVPKDLRKSLENHFDIRKTEIATTHQSLDGSIKSLFRLYDGNHVEGVLIPAGQRITACISSQVGCSLNCKFCATGYLPRRRNLDAHEIVNQVRILSDLALDKYDKKLSNIVYMGMGEPLLNYREVINSIRRITSPMGLGISPQRITVSTAGISKMIYKLADERLGVNLALSLHSADNTKRSDLMPINENNNLDSLQEAMKYFHKVTRIRPTLEYTIMEGVNDQDDDLYKLIQYAKKFPCKINIIEYNTISFAEFKPTGENRLDFFAQELASSGIIVNVRRSRGKDIHAACGQLAAK
jgi:23S rRNA (adenine2503-C2)-methyltransferase